MDSLGVVDVIVELEEEFDIVISPTEVEREDFDTPNKICAVLKGIVNPEAEAPRCDTQVHVDYLESVPYDDSDRNRTSPFAFTGNKFEFRMPQFRQRSQCDE